MLTSGSARFVTAVAVFAFTAVTSGCCKSNDTEPTPTAPAVADTPANTPTTAPANTPPPAVDDGDEEEGYQSNGFPKRMPKTRTPIPTVKEWGAAPLVTTKKLPDGCTMKFVREWLKLNCSKDNNTLVPLEVTGITGMGGNGADYFVFAKSGSVIDLVVRTVDGKKGSATFVTSRGSFRVGYDWPYRAPFPSTIFQ